MEKQERRSVRTVLKNSIKKDQLVKNQTVI